MARWNSLIVPVFPTASQFHNITIPLFLITIPVFFTRSPFYCFSKHYFSSAPHINIPVFPKTSQFWCPPQVHNIVPLFPTSWFQCSPHHSYPNNITIPSTGSVLCWWSSSTMVLVATGSWNTLPGMVSWWLISFFHGESPLSLFFFYSNRQSIVIQGQKHVLLVAISVERRN